MSDIEYTYGSKFICLRNGEQYTRLAQCPDGTEDSEEWNDNAEKIVDVLNSHASLVEENERLRELARRSLEMAKVMEGMTGCRGDDEWVWGLMDDLKSALGATNA